MHCNASSMTSMGVAFLKAALVSALQMLEFLVMNTGAQAKKLEHELQMQLSLKAKANPVLPFLDKPRGQAWRHLLMDRGQDDPDQLITTAENAAI